MPLWSLFAWGNCHVPRNIPEWEKRRAGFLAGSPALSLFLGLPSALGRVTVSLLRPGVLIAHGGLGLLPVGGRCDFMVNGAGRGSLCVTAHYDYFCKTAMIGKSLS